ncbi:MAG: ImmA/IrrE family metallo-endopeptidase [Dehalococcoidia bacterium]|nr:ImmA/IrrE family metallo-endopeptidase [Dehalococcoidia bacterium]
MTQKPQMWEDELWGYLTTGNGTSCPLRASCEVRRSGGWCFDDHTEEISQSYSASTFGAAEENVVKSYFPEHWAPGRIFQLVEQLATKYLRKTAPTRLPVPPEIIKRFEIRPPVEVRLVPLRAYHGAVWRLEDCWVIHINSNDPHSRQRLTLFHEVFHILAHSKATPIFRKRGISEGVFNEVLADHFAGCILMPAEKVRKKWEKVGDVRRMARAFSVTELAMWMRLKGLGLI